jgi:hypothetical protein
VVPGPKRSAVVDLDLPSTRAILAAFDLKSAFVFESALRIRCPVGVPRERFQVAKVSPDLWVLAPMPKCDDHKKISPRRAGLLDHVARALAVAERRFRGADQLDYVIRRRLFPTPFGEGTRSMPHKEASIRRSGQSDIRDAIGRCLREQYAPERSMPARLANLLRSICPRRLFERGLNKSVFATL